MDIQGLAAVLFGFRVVIEGEIETGKGVVGGSDSDMVTAHEAGLDLEKLGEQSFRFLKLALLAEYVGEVFEGHEIAGIEMIEIANFPPGAPPVYLSRFEVSVAHALACVVVELSPLFFVHVVSTVR